MITLELETLALRAVAALDTCMGDNLDRMACHGRIRRLPIADRNTVLARIKELGDINTPQYKVAALNNSKSTSDAKKLAVYTRMHTDGYITSEELEAELNRAGIGR